VPRWYRFGVRRLVDARITLRVAAGLAPLGVCLCPPLAHAYRTAAELSQFEGSDPIRWQQPHVLFDRGEGAAPDGVENGEEAAALRDAAESWGWQECQGPIVSNSGVRGVPIAPNDGVNVIAWVAAKDMPGDIPDDTPAITDVQYASDDDRNWTIAEADIYLNRDIAWGGTDGADLTTVLTHEVGHVVGLLHPCEPDGRDGAPDCAKGDFADSIMYPLYESSGALLSDDDRDGYCSLYETTDPALGCASLGCSTPDGGVPLDVEAASDAGTASDARASKPFGAACDTASDCADGVCVDDGEHGPVCTRACGADAGTCPAAWSCADVDEALVCVNRDSGLCHVAHPGSATGMRGGWFALLALVAVRFSRRRMPSGKSVNHHEV